MSRPAALSWSYEIARTKDEAIDASKHAIACLDELGDMILGHDGDHLVSEALKNVRAVARYLRRAARKERA